MKNYNWNEHGVCTNPDVINIITNSHTVKIETAKRDGEWYYGFDYNNDNYTNYRGRPCMFEHQQGCSTQDRAVVCAILHIKRVENPKGEILQKLMKVYFDKAQLTLF